MTRRMACSESSYWRAETAVVRSCSKPRKLASGRARSRARPDAYQCRPIRAPRRNHARQSRHQSRGLQTPGAVGRPFTVTARNQHLASAKRASPPIWTARPTQRHAVLDAHEWVICACRITVGGRQGSADERPGLRKKTRQRPAAQGDRGAGEWVDASQARVLMMPCCQPAGSVTGDFGLSGVIPCQVSEGQVGRCRKRLAIASTVIMAGRRLLPLAAPAVMPTRQASPPWCRPQVSAWRASSDRAAINAWPAAGRRS